MNFFEHQRRARLKVGRLVLLFVVAVFLIVMAVDAVALFAVAVSDARILDTAEWRKPVLSGASLVTVGIIGAGTLYRIIQLSRGGEALADLIGARRILPETGDPNERKLRNVVEEMAIASGSRIPELYVLDEEASVNALSAGLEPAHAVIVVSRGAVERLTRDELQGLVAHEFSHIFNGDMQLNLRLVGVLNGIMVIGGLGLGILRNLSYSRRSSSTSDSSAKDDSVLGIVGVALVVIGYVGVFFGRWIQCAVSREREYLADASAVQFTRNPLGIGGALKKTIVHGSALLNLRTDQFSHMLFVRGFGWESGWFATHPPIAERISRIEPGFDVERYRAEARAQGKFVKNRTADEVFQEMEMKGHREGNAPSHVISSPIGDRLVFPVLESVGKITSQSLAVAKNSRAQIPEDLDEKIRRAPGAVVLAWALFVDADPASREQQYGLLRKLAKAPPPERIAEIESVRARLATLAPETRLILLDLALPALKVLSAEARVEFFDGVRTLVQADGKTSLMEYCYWTILERQLRYQRIQQFKYFSIAQLREDTELLLSAMAHAGAADETSTRAAFQAAMTELMPGPHRLKAPRELSGEALKSSLIRLSELVPRQKEKVLSASLRCALSDRNVSVAESELLRAVSEVLDCPLPRLEN